uniref:Uncharacterized protein n=1 Tax=Hordeum vulgare subsp. vulgare TaxID=112509 RepID=A0A8I6Y3R5_HORVV
MSSFFMNPLAAATPAGARQGHRRRRLAEGAPASPRVAVSDVLAAVAASFVCNSDALYFIEPPPALAYDELLRPGQIYFLLPAAGLGRPLSSADMAALAVRATAAIAAKRPERRRGKKNPRVVPVREEVVDSEDVLFNEKLNERTLGEFAVSVSPAKKSNGKLAARGVAAEAEACSEHRTGGC